MGKSTLVVLSGGMDSATVLALYHQLLYRVEAISFDYGQRHRKELDYARKLAAHYGVPHKVVDVSSLRELFGKSSQTDRSVAVPHGHYTAPSMKTTVVPNRNMIMASIAAAWAITQKLDGIAMGTHAGDHAIYPDCRPEFMSKLSATLAVADWKPVQVMAPFIQFDKAEICRMGSLFAVPWDLTWSCYEGGEYHCGACGTCVERREAFAKALAADPTIYLNQPQPAHGALGSTSDIVPSDGYPF